jgi:hypothetical protein
MAGAGALRLRRAGAGAGIAVLAVAAWAAGAPDGSHSPLSGYPEVSATVAAAAIASAAAKIARSVGRALSSNMEGSGRPCAPFPSPAEADMLS